MVCSDYGFNVSIAVGMVLIVLFSCCCCGLIFWYCYRSGVVLGSVVLTYANLIHLLTAFVYPIR